MNVLIEEHQELLQELVKHEVNFLLIGGYAVIYYGYERTTGDMDIWLEPNNDNLPKLLSALKAFGIDDEDIAQLSKVDLTITQLFFIGEKPRRIDFLTKVNGIGFSEAMKQANYFEMEGVKVPIIHYHHLILTKMTTGRLKDQADIEELQRINKSKE